MEQIEAVQEQKIKRFKQRNKGAQQWPEEVWRVEKEMFWINTLFNGKKSKNATNVKIRLEEMRSKGFEISPERVKQWVADGFVEVRTFGQADPAEFLEVWAKNPFPTNAVHFETRRSSKAGLAFNLEKL